jgi:CBS domain-containing protein
MSLGYKAKLLVRPVVTAPPFMTVKEAAHLMSAHRIGCVVVTYQGAIEGIFTERDVLFRVVEAGKDPATTQLSEVMTARVLSVEADQPLEKVFELLSESKFRHVPITEGGKLIGMISLTDMARVLREALREDAYLMSFVTYLQYKHGSGARDSRPT